LEKPFRYVHQITDRTLPRFDENSKLIAVEGAHAIGKTDFAKELAEEFEMHYIGPPSHEDIFIFKEYNFDWRKYNDMYPEWFKCFGEKDFFQNPMGEYEGQCDRYHARLYQMKWINQLKAQQHIMNTGQGVVLEGCANADYCHFNAAYNAGWIQEEMKFLYKCLLKETLFHVPKPNLMVYLDAPVDVVQKNIKARGNEWDKDSPVWNNTQYLTNIYNEYKKNWLRDMQEYSRVLVYDWSEGGDTEVVIEDIEATELDMIEMYSNQQKDWRFGDEVVAAQKRYQCTNPMWVEKKLRTFKIDEIDFSYILRAPPAQSLHMEDILRHISVERFAPGANKHLGDNTLLMDLFGIHSVFKSEMALKHNRFFGRGIGNVGGDNYATAYEFKHTRLD
jgi:NADH dehydrogenase (ubiquinone) 1 alpha subcomplex subunit 10